MQKKHIRIAIFFCIIAVLSGCGSKVIKHQFESKLINYDIELKSQKLDVIERIKVGDKLLDDVKTLDAGVIKEIKDIKPNEEIFENKMNGTFDVIQSKTSYQCIITVESKSMVNNGTLLIGERDIKVGRFLTVMTKAKDYIVGGYITSINIIE